MKNRIIYLRLLVLSIGVFIGGCNQAIKFDSAKWKMKDDIEYPYRNKMLGDLTNNYKLLRLKLMSGKNNKV